MYKTLFLTCIFHQSALAQYPSGSFFFAKEFSKDQTLYYGKTFIVNEVLGKKKDVVQFYLDPLAAANSGELTTLVYKCESQNKEGLILGFYGSRWNNAGVNYLSYGFKELPINDANELLDRIEMEIDKNSKFLQKNQDNNNVYFSVKDITVLLYQATYSIVMRLYWNGYDAEWEWSAYNKTKKRLAKKLK